MKRNDDFSVRHQKLAGMSDEELKAYFWKLAQGREEKGNL